MKKSLGALSPASLHGARDTYRREQITTRKAALTEYINDALIRSEAVAEIKVFFPNTASSDRNPIIVAALEDNYVRNAVSEQYERNGWEARWTIERQPLTYSRYTLTLREVV